MKRRELTTPFRIGALNFRPLTEADLPRTLAWRNQERVRSQLLHTHEVTPDEHAAWFREYLERDDDAVFVFSDPQGPVGQAALYKIDWETKTADFGRLMVGESRALGQRHGTVATLALCDFAFRKLGLDVVRLIVRADNHAAIRAYERAGFSPVSALPGGKQIMVARAGPERDWEHWDNDDEIVERIICNWQCEPEPTHRRWLAEHIQPHIELADPPSVIEVGCGNGEVYKALVAAGMRSVDYLGYDVSRRMLARAQWKHPGEFYYGDALSGLPQTGTVVLCCEVLGHLPSAEPMLRELLRLTRDGGHCFVSMWLGLNEQMQQERVGPATFLHHIYSRNEIFALIRRLDSRAEIQAHDGALTTLLHIRPRALPEPIAPGSGPRHTVILGSYNRPNFVRRAITSVFAQTQRSWQLIITDDDSNADTIAAIQETIGSDPRCTLLRYSEPEPSAIRSNAQYRAIARINDALPLVRGDLVHYLPDDDFFPPDRFEVFDEAFRKQPELHLVYGRLKRVDPAGAQSARDIFPGGPCTEPVCQLDHTQVVHRSSCLNAVPQWTTEGIYYDSDGMFFKQLVLAGFGPIMPVDHPVSYHCDHSHNLLKLKENITSQREP